MNANIEPWWQALIFSCSKNPWVTMRRVAVLLLAATCCLAQDTNPAATFSVTGIVKSASTPIPGATVTAINSATQEKTQTSTDTNGAYSLQLSAQGKYQLRVEMPAFSPSTRDIDLAAPVSHADLELTLVSRSQQAVHTQSRPTTARAGAGRGFQSMAVMQGLAAAESSGGGGADQIVPSGMPVPGIAPDIATESVSVSGSGSGVGMFGMNTDELDQRMREGREQAGGFGGPGGGAPGGGGPGGGPGTGGARRRRPSRWWRDSEVSAEVAAAVVR